MPEPVHDIGGSFEDIDLDATRSPDPNQALASRRYQPFPVDLLPEPVRGFVNTAAKAIACDAALIAVPLIAEFGSAIGDSRRVALKGSWLEPPIFWTGIVAESGSAKSPAFDAALEPLKQMQAKLLAEYDVALANHSRELAVYEADYAEWKKHRDGDVPFKPSLPLARRMQCSDTTVEALAILLRDNPRGLLLTRDELGAWFGSFDAYRGGKGGDAAAYLEMHRGGSITVDRRSRERVLHVPRAALCITGGIQPRILARSLGVEHFDNGMAARFLFVMPPRMPKTWTAADIPAHVKASLATIFGKLVALQGVRGELGTEPKLVPLTDSGLTTWVVFYNEHARELAQLEGPLAAAWSKLEAYAARFALLIHELRCASEDPTLEDREKIDAASMDAAVRLTRWFAAETRRVYAALGETGDEAEVRALYELVDRHGGRMSARDLMRARAKFRASKVLAESELARLVGAGFAVWELGEPPANGGPQTRVCRLIQAEDAVGVGDKRPDGEGVRGRLSLSPAASGADTSDTPGHEDVESAAEEGREDGGGTSTTSDGGTPPALKLAATTSALGDSDRRSPATSPGARLSLEGSDSRPAEQSELTFGHVAEVHDA